MEKKGTREKHQSGVFRKDRPKKRLPPKNPNQIEQDDSFVSSSAKKLKYDDDFVVPETNNIGYEIFNFITVFAAISACVKCKQCDSNIEFKKASIRGLGFKICVMCDKCEATVISSCPSIGSAYEINTRICIAFRLLGVGLNEIKKFCGLMDLPIPVSQPTFDKIMNNILTASVAIRDLILKKAVKKEQEEMMKATTNEDVTKLTISGDGSWQTRGFQSRFGISSIIGYFSGKVLDVLAKSISCKVCEYWKKKKTTAEFEEWKEKHNKSCSINHQGSSGKMEADAIKEIFVRSEERYGVKYINYIGNGDTKTYSAVVESKPYGDVEIIKKEYIGHVQKHMGSRLRALVKKEKNLMGKGKLSGKMIDKLTIYYGLAIRRNTDSIKNMYDAIWSTFFHYSSTDENPKHQYCPRGLESWCAWQRTNAKGELSNFKHKSSLPDFVLEKIKPIYQNLSKDTLLQRCLGGFTQNANESFNHLVWAITPKSLNCGPKMIEIALNITTGLFNEGMISLLKIMETLGINIGPRAQQYAAQENCRRITKAERDAQNATKEARILRRHEHEDLLEMQLITEDLFYGPGIDDLL